MIKQKILLGLSAVLLPVCVFDAEAAVSASGLDFAVPHFTKETRFIHLERLGEVTDISDGVFGIQGKSNLWSFFRAEDGRCLFKDVALSVNSGSRHPVFDNGVAMVRSPKASGQRANPLMILNKNGTVQTLPENWLEASDFVDGIAAVKTENENRKTVIFYIDRSGKQVYPNLAFTQAKDEYGYYELKPVKELSEGMRPYYSYRDKLWGYMDENGNVVIKPQFADARPFREGFAAVAVKEGHFGTKSGFIDKTGAWVIEPMFEGSEQEVAEELSDVCNGLIRFIKDRSTLYYDTSGSLVKQFEATVGTPFVQGKALLKKGLFDSSITVVDTEFNTLSHFVPDSNWDFNWGKPKFNGRGIAVTASDRVAINTDGKILLQCWDLENNRWTGGEFEGFSDDGYSQAWTYMRQGKKYRGVVKLDGEFTVVYSTNAKDGEGMDTVPFPVRPPVPLPPPGPGPLPEPEPEPQPKEPQPQEMYKVTVIASPPEGGTVSGGGKYAKGDTAVVSATASEGWELVSVESEPDRRIAGDGLRFRVTGDLEITGYFLKADSVYTCGNGIFAGVKYNDWEKGDMAFYAEFYGNQKGETPFGENATGFFAAMLDPEKLYKEKDESSGTTIEAKMFLPPLRIDGFMDDRGKRYLMLVGGNVNVSDIKLGGNAKVAGWANLLLMLNSASKIDIAASTYRVEVLEADFDSGLLKLGMLQRFSPKYGWLSADDKTFEKRSEKILMSITKRGLPADFFNGLVMKRAEKRNDVCWYPPESWYQEPNKYEGILDALKDLYKGLQSDWQEAFSK